MSINKKAEPLVVRVRGAQEMLGGCGRRQIYDLIRSGELLSCKHGRSRLIFVESIRELVRRWAEAAK